MLSNLKAEMARKNISGIEISKAIGRNAKTVSEKICGRTQFTMTEAITIRDTFFPSFTLEYLFSDETA